MKPESSTANEPTRVYLSLGSNVSDRAVQLREILRNQIAVSIVPGPAPDPVAGVHGRCRGGRLGAEIGTPAVVARALRFRQRLTLRIRSGKPAQVSAFAKPLASNKEARDRLGAAHRD